MRLGIALSLAMLLLCGQAAAQAKARVSLDEAIALAIAHSPTLKAARTQVPQNQASEITANLRPNPVLSWDTQFIPLFQPSQFSADYFNNTAQFDLGVGYLLERGGKRQHRLEAARNQTAVTTSQVADAERTLTFNVAQQFVNVLLAESNLSFANDALKSYQDTVNISQERYKAGDISEGDLLKIKLQMLQFQTDVSAAQIARTQALVALRQLIGYQALTPDFDVVGDLAYQPLKLNEDDLKAAALRRPDVVAAQKGVALAQSQHTLEIANGKRDLNTSFNYSHVAGVNTGAFFFNMEIPIFDLNQGEIKLTQFAVDQSKYTETAAEETALADVANAYEAFRSSDQVVQLYTSGYLDQAKESRDISQYAYRGGAASLLDLLDAERSFRQTQLAYRQALANYMLAVEQVREAVGTRNLP
ncbi:MAG TPA: TolC family protein [Terriglobales bacterium]|nr:TolC family protein [Terriglobales bacterium]